MPTKRHRISVTSPAAASTVVSTEVTGLDKYDSLIILAVLAGGTGGTLDVYLQVATKEEDGAATEWVDYAHFAQIADGAAAIKRLWSVTRHAQITSIATIGIGTASTPAVALAANTILGGEFGSRMRVVFVAGAGTSAGAAQIIDIIGTRLTS